VLELNLVVVPELLLRSLVLGRENGVRILVAGSPGAGERAVVTTAPHLQEGFEMYIFFKLFEVFMTKGPIV